MFVPKVFLSSEITQDKLFKIVENDLAMNEVKEVKQNLNTIEVLTEWSRFELKLNGKELSIHQRWNKDKMWIVVGLLRLAYSFGSHFCFYFI